MNVKAVVKVMNFHALLRVDNSRRVAERYQTMVEELESFMKIIINNKNILMDKLIRLPDPDAPVLRIYIGSDYGFCGSVNSSVVSVMKEKQDGKRVIIGKKIRRTEDSELFLLQEEFAERFEELTAIFEKAVDQQPWSAIELVYNEYLNASAARQITKKIYPPELSGEKEKKPEKSAGYEDFMMEGEPRRMLRDLTVTYLNYMLKIAMASSYASENVMRQAATTESLKKIDEIEEEERKAEWKRRSEESFRKTIDGYTRSHVLIK